MNDNKVLIYEFWFESIVPKTRKALKNSDANALIDAVVNRADRDTMKGGRFNKAYADNHKSYRKELSKLIIDNKNNLSSSLIYDMKSIVIKGVTLGLVQKIVNMSLKYLYAIDAFGFSSGLEINVDIKNCDCPLDSRILERLSYDYGGKKYTPWTQITDVEEYKDIQKDIEDTVKKLGAESKMYYDFKYWGLPVP